MSISTEKEDYFVSREIDGEDKFQSRVFDILKRGMNGEGFESSLILH